MNQTKFKSGIPKGPHAAIRPHRPGFLDICHDEVTMDPEELNYIAGFPILRL